MWRNCRLHRTKKVVPVVIEGLRKLETRLTTSAGIAVVNDGKLEVRRAPGNCGP